MFSKLLTEWLVPNLCLVLLHKILFAEARVSPNETTLIFYHGPTFADSMVYKLTDANQIPKNPNFNKKETHLYLHGWNESQHSESVHVIVDSYLTRKDINIITLDWADAAKEAYFQSVDNVKELAPVLSDAIENLYNAGIDRKCFTVVSHSLGSQLAGMTGKHMRQKSNGTLKIYKPEFTDSVVYEFSDATQILENPNFNKNETHLYIHGFKESQDSESIRVIVSSYFKQNKVNIVTVDWAKAAGEDYLSAVSNAQALAPVLADTIISFYKAGIDRESLTVVAHSLGAQLAGMTGRNVIQKSNGSMKIYR